VQGGTDFAAELVSALNEVSFMFVVDLPGLEQHLSQNAISSSQSIGALREIAMSIMRMRSNDFAKPVVLKTIEDTQSLGPTLSRVGSIFNRVVKG
jgi:hypothetical protein